MVSRSFSIPRQGTEHDGSRTMDWYDSMNNKIRGDSIIFTANGGAETEMCTPEPAEDAQDDASFDDEENFAPVQYARLHGLTADHTLARLDITLPPTPQSMIADLSDPPEAPSVSTLISLNELNEITDNEKWNVDREAIGFLASIMKPWEEDMATADAATSYHDFRQLKLEEAILSMDPDLDLVQLKRRNALRLSTTGMSPCDLGDDVLWTSEELHLPARLDLRVSQERLDVDAETMWFLKNIHQPSDEDDSFLSPTTAKVDDFTSDVSGKMAYKQKSTHIQPLTPPLLPMSPPREPMGISGPGAELEFTSTPEDLVALEARILDDHIMQGDNLSLKEIDGGSSPTPMNSDDIAKYIAPCTSSLSSPCHRKRMRDLRLEVPLLHIDDEHPAKRSKTVSWSDEVREISAMPIATEDVANNWHEPAEEDFSIESILKPLAEAADAAVASEQLDEADTITRIEVPEVDDVLLQVPWETFRKLASTESLESQQKNFMSLMKNDYCKRDLKWPGTSSLEKKLPWSPFPTMFGRVQEEPFDDGSFARYMSCLSFGDEIDIDVLISYHPRMVREVDEDLDFLELMPITEVDMSSEHLKDVMRGSDACLNVDSRGIMDKPVQPATAGRMDMRQLLQKRKNELENTTKPDISVTGNAPGAFDPRSTVTPNDTKAPLDAMQGVGGLSNFLRMHGKTFGEKDLVAVSESPPQMNQQTEAPTAAMLVAEPQSPAHHQPHAPSCPVPSATSLDHQASVIVSSAFLNRHEVIRAIQAALPTLDFIERMPLSNPTRRSGIATAIQDIDEADMTITPNMGVMTTTLQKLKQKALPGQKDFLSVYDRVSSIALRYRRVIVLVSEGSQPNNNSNIATELDERDTHAFNDLSTLYAEYDADIEAIYVPGGDPQLANWLVAFISRHCSSQTDTPLLSEETTWERFLRKAGFNAFAAQALLAALKHPDNVSGPHGIAEFVLMVSDQRMRFLNGVFNGGCVVQDLKSLIDRRWPFSEPRGQAGVQKR